MCPVRLPGAMDSLQGFRKVHPDRWEFAHESFLRGQTHLLPRIVRRKKRGEGAASSCSAAAGDAGCAAIGGEDRHQEQEGQLDQEEWEALLEEVQRLRREQTAIGEELAQISRCLQATEQRPDQLPVLPRQARYPKGSSHPVFPISPPPLLVTPHVLKC